MDYDDPSGPAGFFSRHTSLVDRPWGSLLSEKLTAAATETTSSLTHPRHSTLISESMKRSTGSSKPSTGSSKQSTGSSKPGFPYSEKSYQISDGKLYSVFSPVQSRRSNSRPSFLHGTQATVSSSTSPITSRKGNNRRFKLKFHHQDVPPSYRNRSTTPESKSDFFSKASEDFFKESEEKSHFESNSSNRRHRFESSNESSSSMDFDSYSSQQSKKENFARSSEEKSNFEWESSTSSERSNRESNKKSSSDEKWNFGWDSNLGSREKWRLNREEVPSPLYDSFYDIKDKFKKFDAESSSDEDEPLNLCLADSIEKKMKSLKKRIKIKTEPLDPFETRRASTEKSSIFDSFYDRRKSRLSEDDVFEKDFDKLKQKTQERFDRMKQDAYSRLDQEEALDLSKTDRYCSKSSRFPYISDMLDSMTLKDDEKFLRPFWERHEELERKLKEWCKDEYPPSTATKPPPSPDPPKPKEPPQHHQQRPPPNPERKPSPKVSIPEINVEKPSTSEVSSPSASDIYVGNVPLPYNYLYVPDGYQQNIGLHPMFDIGKQSWASVASCSGESLKRSHSCDNATATGGGSSSRSLSADHHANAAEVKKSASEGGTSQGMFPLTKNKSADSKRSSCDNDISICKFKLIRGAQPMLEQKKSFYMPQPSRVNKEGATTVDLPVPGSSKERAGCRKFKFHSQEDLGRKGAANKRYRRRSQKALMREKLEATFRDQGFLIKTQQVSSAEGAVYCKFRQLKKFTRYLFKSWKDYLPKDIDNMNQAAAAASGENPAILQPPDS